MSDQSTDSWITKNPNHYVAPHEGYNGLSLLVLYIIIAIVLYKYFL
jgi:hypothetical protein